MCLRAGDSTLLKLPKKQKSSHQRSHGLTRHSPDQQVLLPQSLIIAVNTTMLYTSKAKFSCDSATTVTCWQRLHVTGSQTQWWQGVQVLCNAEVSESGLPASPDCQAASTPMAIAALAAMGMAHANNSRVHSRQAVACNPNSLQATGLTKLASYQIYILSMGHTYFHVDNRAD